ncbi:tRNA lysidine(34) synthetase TilS [Mesorhizobium sp. CAU 1732]|uniref:tRNA lysidine(34) synthetase TilS n=1 Tax=Mesorhizobium sp. CAU 1732 TaxID=3140358 RepID=UPI0032610199
MTPAAGPRTDSASSRIDPALLFSSLDLSANRVLVVAVSGGSDSLALLVLLREFLIHSGSSARAVAVTVDHGLRAEAADEARQVAAFCNDHGIDHRAVTWRGMKPATGLIAAAREARYDLLAHVAEEVGASAILTGHTMDDQAETVAMRAERGEGAGLAGMAPATLFDDRIWIVRPLLGVRRQRLRDDLVARGIAWIDDPTNRNPSYERVRMRGALGESGTVEDWADRARAAASARRDIAQRAADVLGQHATSPAAGLFRLDHAVFRTSHRDGGVQALRALLAVAGGTSHLPDATRTAALFDRIGRETLRATLSRAVVDARSDAVWIRREARTLPILQTFGNAVWDGRWRIAATGPAKPLSVGPLGPGHAKAMNADIAGVPPSLVRAALAAEPAVFDGEALAGLLGAGQVAAGVTAVRIASPYARFLPDFDLPLAMTLRQLVGAPALPSAPLNNHIDEGP